MTDTLSPTLADRVQALAAEERRQSDVCAREVDKHKDYAAISDSFLSAVAQHGSRAATLTEAANALRTMEPPAMATEREAMIADARARFELLRRQDKELDGNDIALIRSECGVAMAKAVVNLKGAAQWAVEYGNRLGDTLTAQAAEIDQFGGLLTDAHAEIAALKARVAELETQKDGAYSERDQLVCALSKCFPSWLERHPNNDQTWDNDWRWIVFVQLPTGQASWHIHDSEYPWFSHLAFRDHHSWDGHTTAEKYERLNNLESRNGS